MYFWLNFICHGITATIQYNVQFHLNCSGAIKIFIIECVCVFCELKLLVKIQGQYKIILVSIFTCFVNVMIILCLTIAAPVWFFLATHAHASTNTHAHIQ